MGHEKAIILVDFPCPDAPGGVVRAEVEVVDQAGGTATAARGQRAVEAASITFQAALEQVRPIVQAVYKQLNNLVASVKEVQVQFGVKLNGKTGIVIASASVEASFQISLKW